MKHLVIIRHGEIDQGGHLTNRGMDQMKELAVRLKPLCGGHAVRVISSAEPGATKSAGILAVALYAKETVREHPILFSDQDHPADTAAAIAVILTEGKTAEVLLVVTHAEHSRNLPSGIRQHLFKCAWPERTLGFGEAVRLNLETKEMKDVK